MLSLPDDYCYFVERSIISERNNQKTFSIVACFNKISRANLTAREEARNSYNYHRFATVARPEEKWVNGCYTATINLVESSHIDAIDRIVFSVRKHLVGPSEVHEEGRYETVLDRDLNTLPDPRRLSVASATSGVDYAARESQSPLTSYSKSPEPHPHTSTDSSAASLLRQQIEDEIDSMEVASGEDKYDKYHAFKDDIDILVSSSSALDNFFGAKLCHYKMKQLNEEASEISATICRLSQVSQDSVRRLSEANSTPVSKRRGFTEESSHILGASQLDQAPDRQQMEGDNSTSSTGSARRGSRTSDTLGDESRTSSVSLSSENEVRRRSSDVSLSSQCELQARLANRRRRSSTGSAPAERETDVNTANMKNSRRTPSKSPRSSQGNRSRRGVQSKRLSPTGSGVKKSRSLQKTSTSRVNRFVRTTPPHTRERSMSKSPKTRSTSSADRFLKDRTPSPSFRPSSAASSDHIRAAHTAANTRANRGRRTPANKRRPRNSIDISAKGRRTGRLSPGSPERDSTRTFRSRNATRREKAKAERAAKQASELERVQTIVESGLPSPITPSRGRSRKVSKNVTFDELDWEEDRDVSSST